MSSSLKQEALRASKGEFMQITIKMHLQRRDPDKPVLSSQSGQMLG